MIWANLHTLLLIQHMYTNIFNSLPRMSVRSGALRTLKAKTTWAQLTQAVNHSHWRQCKVAHASSLSPRSDERLFTFRNKIWTPISHCDVICQCFSGFSDIHHNDSQQWPKVVRTTLLIRQHRSENSSFPPRVTVQLSLTPLYNLLFCTLTVHHC